MENRIGKNRPSPKNEDAFTNAYRRLNHQADKPDGLDVAAVIAKDGTRGHGLMAAELNRSHDNEYHRVKDFIPDAELKKAMSK